MTSEASEHTPVPPLDHDGAASPAAPAQEPVPAAAAAEPDADADAPEAAAAAAAEAEAGAEPAGAETAEPSAGKPAGGRAADLSPAQCAAQLAERFPALFGRHPKPLKLRIQADIQQRAPGVFSKRALSIFLHRHTGSTSYLIALSKAKERFDLDGQPAGELSEEHRQAANEELARRRTNHQARREQEEQGRRERADLLYAFERTTLTPANFCALKGIAPESLDKLLEVARKEAAERALQPPPRREGFGGGRGGPGGRGPREGGGAAGRTEFGSGRGERGGERNTERGGPRGPDRPRGGPGGKPGPRR